MERSRRIGPPLAVALAAMSLVGCATVPRDRDIGKVNETLAARSRPAPAWPNPEAQAGELDARVAKLIEEPLSTERAVELAFLRNVEIQKAYAELGFAQADILGASRIGNPTLGYIGLKPSDGGAGKITRSVSMSFTDLLLLRAGTRLARGEVERVRSSIGASLLDLAAHVEAAWYDYVTAQQVAEMRAAVARATDATAEFAQRLRDAGNIKPRDLALESAAAGEARVAASRASAESIRARATLAQLMGISTREQWRTATRLPAPRTADDSAEALTAQALDARLDLTAARREVAILEDGLGITRHWRWLGAVDVGYEKESESDGSRLRGPSLAVQVPLFNQNQAGVLRAQAALEGARARLAGLDLAVRNDVAAGLDRLATARQITDSYRTALLPQREAVVDRTQEEFNYMLIGAFELVQAKREQFNAYQEYLEAVREYWLARTELKRAVGGHLPGDDEPTPSTIGVEDVLEPQTEDMQDMASMPGMKHSSEESTEQKESPPKSQQDAPPASHHHSGEPS